MESISMYFKSSQEECVETRCRSSRDSAVNFLAGQADVLAFSGPLGLERLYMPQSLATAHFVR